MNGTSSTTAQDMDNKSQICSFGLLLSSHTHGDVQPKNLMVDEESNMTGILDWDSSGGYPHS